MILAQDLRINNLVNVNNVGICKIEGLDKIDNTILPIVYFNQSNLQKKYWISLILINVSILYLIMNSISMLMIKH